MNEFLSPTGIQNLGYIEQFYAQYRSNPDSVPPEWRQYFDSTGNGSNGSNGTVKLGPSFQSRSMFNPSAGSGPRANAVEADPTAANLNARLHQLIHNHRVRGHIIAAVNPLGPTQAQPAELDLEYYGFTEAELDLLVNPPELHYETPLTVREVFQRLRDTYCRSIGVQYMHIGNLAIRQWLQRRMEGSQNRLRVSREEQLRILTRLTDAVVFEEFLRAKFPGAKTFSLEGCETLIPLLDLAIEKAGHLGVNAIVAGMGHRGRLNVLAHIIGKNPSEIFREFADDEPERWVGGGDVKYHLGHSGDWTMADGRKIHLSLCFNPSHLEFVDPVVPGRVRAKQERVNDRDRRQVLGILVHGDAAFAGEGVVQETLNMSRLPGYSVGGILHVIVNNQIGFTTPPGQGRSTLYPTDVARMLQVPIFHVNGEDPEAVAQVVQLAMDFRAEFQSDVFIDMYGYRRLGHNETDEPTFTQPVLYRKIAERPNVRESYLNNLLESKNVTREEADKILNECQAKLEKQLQSARTEQRKISPERPGLWKNYIGGPEPTGELETGVDTQRLSTLLRQLSELPEWFQAHPKLKKLMETRRQMADGKAPLDWAAGEALGLATLATSGVPIRLTGQDTGRGTFSHRHAILYDQEDGDPFIPLQQLAPNQATVEILNSPLCETGALGFEYGYSLDYPDGLVIWEAQFGDFVNAAQVIIDQFITSAEDKWRRLSGLVLLLPHGFEGMGPEHSSARMERFLTLAAKDNIQIAQPTTPAQFFHLLRRQSLRPWRKPLIVFTPKSLLRHPKAVSTLADCAQGRFQRVLPDDAKPAGIKRILLCTGKVYYDLLAAREEHKRTDVAILRLEQLYPLPGALLEQALKPYADNTPVIWVQEEPANMGAWRYLHEHFGKHLFDRLPLAPVSRVESASPATGSHHAHKLEQAQLIARAFGYPEPSAANVFAPKAAPAPAPASAPEFHNQQSQAKLIMPIEITIPSVGESITEVQITDWLKAEGDTVKAEEAIAVIDSDKSTLDLPAPQAGKIIKILHTAGEKVAVGTVVAHMEAVGAAANATAAKSAEKKAPEKSEAVGADKSKSEKPKSAEAPKTEKAKPAPTAEKATPPATPKEEAKAPSEPQPENKAAEAPAPAAKTAPPARPASTGGREEEVVPMTMLRRAVARHLVEAKQTMAMLTTFNEVDMSAVLALRKQHQEAFEKRYQVKLGMMSFFIKAVIDALKQFPQLNAEIRGNDIVYRNYFDIDVAIATERGLVVPALRNADRLSFAELEKAIGDLARRARDGKLKPEEFQGGTFTITNGGSFGSLLSTPIINPPQSGILGMHSIQERPIALDGQVVIRPMMYVALTYDHRLVDGREAVLFLRRIKEVIENPSRLLIEI